MGATRLHDRYHYRAGWCEGPQCYVATCSEFQGLTAQSDTPERALAVLKMTVKAMVDGMIESGGDVPEPMIAPDVTDREDAHGRRSPDDDGPLNDCT